MIVLLIVLTARICVISEAWVPWHGTFLVDINLISLTPLSLPLGFRLGVAAKDLLYLAMTALRVKNDKVAPVDTPNPPKNYVGCQELENAHNELRLVGDVPICYTDRDAGAHPWQDNVKGTDDV